jgi:hypothetical protein
MTSSPKKVTRGSDEEIRGHMVKAIEHTIRFGGWAG